MSIGCKTPLTVIGIWHGSFIGQQVAIEFKDDKSFTMSMKEGEMGASFVGTYVVDPKLLTLTTSDYQLTNVPDPLLPLATQSNDSLKNKVYKLLYHFNSENELAVTYNGKVDLLKRDPTE